VRHIRNQELLKKIGLRIKSLREKSNLTQEEVFYDTKIHIGRIETATSNVTVSTLEAICKYFDIGLEQFFKGL
jgi:transcriptional regulator with XRE-family HTH domain